MKRLTGLFLFLPFYLQSQQITISDPLKEDGRNINFEIIGKQGGNLLVLEKLSWRHTLNIFDDSLRLKNVIPLEFLPGRTLNVESVNYPNRFFLIYQYQRKGVVHCMLAQFDGQGKISGEPVELDTTQVGSFGDNSVYSLLKSDNRQHVMIFKLQKTDEGLLLNTLLLNDRMEKLFHSRMLLPYTQQRDIYDDFLLDNEGNLVFVGTRNESRKGYGNTVYLFKKPALSDNLISRKIRIDSAYLGSILCKADNLNKRYVITSFYNTEAGGNVDGLFTSVWDARNEALLQNSFIPLGDSIRNAAKNSGSNKSIFDDFELRQIQLKKDGSIIVLSEFYNTQSNINPNQVWNRNSFWNNGVSPYYFYDPFYGSFYRPFSSFYGPGGNTQNIRYYYENILVTGISPSGDLQWNNVVAKQQFSDENDNHLSFGTFHSGDGLHILFNDITKRESLMMDNAITGSGSLRRHPSFKTYEKGIDFMPRYARQTGPREVIVPAIIRSQLVFTRLEL
jgi:hypothetical protein